MSCAGIVLAFIGLILLAGPGDNLLALASELAEKIPGKTGSGGRAAA
jgi:hypothetical protein